MKKNLGFGLGVIPKFFGFWVWVLGFIPKFFWVYDNNPPGVNGVHEFDFKYHIRHVR